MNRKTECFFLAIAVISLATIAVIFGLSLLPSAEAVQIKLETTVPLVLTWGVIVMTVVASVVLAGFLIVTGLKEKN